MKYKIGDKVKVRKDLIVDKFYGKEIFVKEMKKWRGKTLTIDNISPPLYRTEETGSWNWTDEMFEDLDKPKKFTNEVVFK